MDAIQYCEGIASVHVGDGISTVGDRISTLGIASVLRRLFSTVELNFLIFLYLADITNQKLSAIYNFETKIVLDFYRK